MKRANRPGPIQVPPEVDRGAGGGGGGGVDNNSTTTANASFKLTDSGVWSEGGLVFSTAGCIIDRSRAQSHNNNASRPSQRSNSKPM